MGKKSYGRHSNNTTGNAVGGPAGFGCLLPLVIVAFVAIVTSAIIAGAALASEAPTFERSEPTGDPCTATDAPRVNCLTDRDRTETWVVAAGFEGAEIGRAMRVFDCESGFDPQAWNRTTDDRGIAQHHYRFWPERSRAALGKGEHDVWDGWTNVLVAFWLWDRTDDWRHWVCQP